MLAKNIRKFNLIESLPKSVFLIILITFNFSIWNIIMLLFCFFKVQNSIEMKIYFFEYYKYCYNLLFLCNYIKYSLITPKVKKLIWNSLLDTSFFSMTSSNGIIIMWNSNSTISFMSDEDNAYKWLHFTIIVLMKDISPQYTNLSCIYMYEVDLLIYYQEGISKIASIFYPEF